MLRNKILYMLMFLVLVSYSFGAVCEDNIQPLVSCQLVTPVINCVGYEVYSNNQSLIESGNLSLWVSSDIYYFNFSEDIGEYLVKLCDGTTGKFFVNYYNLSVFGQSFNWLAIIIIFVVISLICLWVSKKIVNPDLELFKTLLFFYGMINSFILISLTFFISTGLSLSNFNRYFEVYVILAMLLLILFVLYYGIYLIIKVFKETGKIDK